MRLGQALVLGAALVPLVVWPVTTAADPVIERPPAAQPTARVDYVALGDSYVSGPRIPEQRRTPLLCRRSTHNYPAALAAGLGLTSYVDVSCSGADTADLFRRQTLRDGTTVPRQLAAVGAGTDLVTITIGANEFALFAQVFGRCEQVRRRDPGGSPCRRLHTVDGRDQRTRDAGRVADRVARAVRGVQARAPEAEVYVVGYPRIFPGAGGCRALPFARGDIAWGRGLFTRLNRSLRRGARDEGATYVNPYPASNQHHICAREPWVNGSDPRPGGATAYHPLAVGMSGVAGVVGARITARSE